MVEINAPTPPAATVIIPPNGLIKSLAKLRILSPRGRGSFIVTGKEYVSFSTKGTGFSNSRCLTGSMMADEEKDALRKISSEYDDVMIPLRTALVTAYFALLSYWMSRLLLTEM
jgi:hypothetical protein